MKSCAFLGRSTWKRTKPILAIHLKQLAQLGIVTQRTNGFSGGLCTANLSRVPDLITIDAQIREGVRLFSEPPTSLIDLNRYLPLWLIEDIVSSPKLCNNLGANLLAYIKELYEIRSI